MKSLIFLSLIFISGCQEYSEFRNEKGVLSVLPKGLSIDEIKNLSWKVGNGFRKEVSKGLQVELSLPRLESDVSKEIYKKKGANAWLIRVIKSSTGGYSNEVGSFIIPIVAESNSGRIVSVEGETTLFQLYYASGYMSRRFENFKCPAFGHRKRLKRFAIKRQDILVSSLSLTSRERYEGNPKQASFFPVSFNAGMTLVGDYNIAISLFNTTQKVKLTKEVLYPQIISVVSEDEIIIPECAGFKVPAKGKELGGSREFKFGN